MTSVVDFAIFSTLCVGALSYYRIKKLTEQRAILPKDDRLKVVVISGCDRGLGRLMAERWSRQPHDEKYLVVALTLTNESQQEWTNNNKDNNNNNANNLVAIQCDVTSDQDCQAMKTQVQNLLQEKQAVLYAIVNNAGMASPGDVVFYGSSVELPQKVMDVNYFGQLRVTQALLPLMLTTSQTAGGKIFNMSSVCGASASAGNSSYNASKFAVEAWSDSLRLELAPFEIQVVKLRPGRFRTDIQTEWFDHFVQNYERAPDQIQSLYGNQAYRDVLDKTKTAHANGVGDPQLVVDTMTELLVQTTHKLESYYWIGRDANTFWRALSVLPSHVANALKAGLAFAPQGPKLPPTDTIAHVTIRVRDLDQAVPFYKALGFACVGPIEDDQQLLHYNPAPKGTKWETLIMLQQDKSMPARQGTSDAGYARLCICCQCVDAMVQEVETKGYQAMAPTAVDQQSNTKLAAFQDPDGFVVYYIEFGGLMGLIVNAQLWWTSRPKPFLFSVTVNVTDHVPIFPMFESLGLTTMAEQNKNQIANGLLPALQMDPSTTVIERIRYCISPKGGIIACIMNWTTPRSSINLASATNAMTISVSNVEAALTKAKEVGMHIKDDKPEYRKLPVYGNVLVGTAFLEEGSCPIEFCCFTNQKPY